MTTQTEAMKLALEALELHGQQYPHMVKGYCLDAITALREALAEQPAQQEPVAWMHKIDCDRDDRDDFMAYYKRTPGYCIPLYTTPQPPAQPAQQEPVAWRVKVETKLRDGSVDVGYQLRNSKLSEYDEPLYTTPQAQQEPVKWSDYEPDGVRHNKPSQPRNPAKWLTSEEEQEIKNNCTTVSCVLKAVKAKLSATPQPPAQPLTDAQIFDLAEPFGAFEYGDAQGHKRLAFARDIEAAHGITKGNT